MKSSESISELSAALVKANLVLSNPSKGNTAKIPTKSGGSFSYTYADLASILDDVRPVLHAHGLALVQEAAAADRGVGVTTRLIHTSGEWLEYEALVIPGGGDAQAVGSSITYARRYALCAALSIAADEDDDGAKTLGAGAGGNQPASGTQSSPAPVSNRDERGNQDGPMTVADEGGPQHGTVGSGAPAAAHEHDFKPSPTLPKFEVCECGETKRKGARL